MLGALQGSGVGGRSVVVRRAADEGSLPLTLPSPFYANARAGDESAARPKLLAEPE